MLDENLARLRTHRNNISRYRRLLQTQLTTLERDFIERRLAEEESVLRSLEDPPFLSPSQFRRCRRPNQHSAAPRCRP